MQSECSPALLDFAPVDGRRVVAGFDGGAITSNAGALLLGATDRAINLVGRFAACFRDARMAEQVEHDIATLVGQRIFGIALGHEDVVDHDQLRHDPVLAILAGKLAARRSDCAPLAGKSTLNRLKHAPVGTPGRYHRIGHDGAAIEGLFVDVFLEAHRKAPPRQIILDLDATDVPLHGHQEGRFFHGYYDAYCYLPLYVFCGRHLLAARLRRADIDASAGAVDEVQRIVRQIRAHFRSVSTVQPILPAIDLPAIEPIAAHCDPWPPPWSSTSRTARCRTSGKNRFDVFFVMAPSSQSSGPPKNPGRFSFPVALGYRCGRSAPGADILPGRLTGIAAWRKRTMAARYWRTRSPNSTGLPRAGGIRAARWRRCMP